MDIETYIKESGTQYERHDHPTAYTAQELAAEEHVTGDAVAKAVAVEADDHCVLAVLQATHKIDLDRLAAALNARHCVLVNEDKMAELFPDTELGAEPPFGQPYGLETVVDEPMTRCKTITFNAGSHNRAIRMRFEDYRRLAQPKVAEFSQHI
ncbi:MAG: YbaK/EbsC family protein [Planctomycetaceae bacterium]|nr:YbaK/EbsC family protein [Planctomycetaceae bacterium]